MIKKKQLFKEDKIILAKTKLSKHEHYPLSDNSEDEKEIRRGRQMNTANIITYKKNNSTTCESKDKLSKKGNHILTLDYEVKSKKPKLIKRIHTQSISSSFDSDCSIKKRTYRKKANQIKEKPQSTVSVKTLNDSLDKSEDEGSHNTSGYYEENLFNEIERILIEIINNHINSDKRKNEKDVLKFQNHVKFNSNV
jgi:hypothetical protein